MKSKDVDCPTCGADPGQPCKQSQQLGRNRYHKERSKKAKMITNRKREDFSQAAARIVREATED